MSTLRPYHWRFAVAAFAICGAVALSLGSTYAADVQVDLAQSSDPSATQINTDPFINTGSDHKTQVEPGSFASGNTIVTAMQSGRYFDGGASDLSFSTSLDGGATWQTGTLPATVSSTPAGPYQRASDPSVAYDARHKVWLISYLGIKSPTNADVDVSRSTDGGKTFGPPVIVSSQGADLLDKNWTTCDDSPTSPFFGNCYTEFDDNSQLNLVQLSTSSDGGTSWGTPRTTPDQTCVIGGQPLVQPNGTVIMPISDCFEETVLSIRSTDGGATWSQPSFVGQQIFFGPAGNLRSGDLPSANIDAAGTVYVTWTDCRSEARCTAGVDDMLIASSSDGITWSVPKRIPISKVGSTVEPMLPGLGIDHTTAGGSADVGLVYYFYPNGVIGNNFCGTPTVAACQLEVGFISSTNGGRTWSNPQTLAGPMQLPWLPLTSQGFMVGDYMTTSFVSGSTGSHGNGGESTLAFPIFMIASAPSAPDTTCSNDTTGAPGQDCNQPTFTLANGVKIGGGPNQAEPALGAPAGSASNGFQFQIPEERHFHRAQTVN